MAGNLKLNSVQLGDSATATNNFVWQTNLDGTAKLARGNVGATTQDILTVDAAGKVTLSNSPYVLSPRYVSAAQTITLAGLLTLAHGLGAKPYRVMLSAICTTADAGYSIGDEVLVEPYAENTSVAQGYGVTTRIDATNIYIKFGNGSAGACMIITHPTTGAAAIMLATSWQLYVRAEL